MRELLITKTVGTIQAYTNQAAPVKVRSLFSLGFNTQQLYTSFPVLSSDKFNVSNFTKKELHIHSVASPACVCFASFEWHNPPANIAQEEQLLFSKSGFLYTALLVFCRVCRVDCALYKLQAPKHHTQMHTDSVLLSLSILNQLNWCYLALPPSSISFMNNGLPISIS